MVKNNRKKLKLEFFVNCMNAYNWQYVNYNSYFDSKYVIARKLLGSERK